MDSTTRRSLACPKIRSGDSTHRPHAEPVGLRRAPSAAGGPVLRAIIDRVGPCRLEPMADRFGTLVRAIISQQISSKAAAAIEGRLRAIGGEPHHPGGPRARRGGAARHGLSGVKARSSSTWPRRLPRAAPLDAFDDSGTTRSSEALTAIKGIGGWTADMFLIFALNRPDVLPVGDLGVRAALRDRHGLAEIPRPSECPALADTGGPIARSRSGISGGAFDTPQPPTIATVEAKSPSPVKVRKRTG